MEINKKNHLGRGLASIFNNPNNRDENNIIQYINLELITTNPFQPRTNFSNKELNELTDSIKEYGLIQPITVRKINNLEYELISGERRLQASKLAGLTQIPVFIKNINTNQMLEVALVENIQRQDLDPIEIALSLQKLTEEYSINQEKLGKKIGKNRSTISNYLRLLKLDPIIQAGLRDKIITMGHAKAIINIVDKKKQITLYKNIIQHNYSVRETEIIVKNSNISENKSSKYNPKILSTYFRKIEEELSNFLNHNVKLKVSKNGKGTIEIPFESEKKLDEIIKILQS
tara:strand:+ start:3253 stop:4116 length:864 start_codon:yes stop_codon:yes gene_type:complete